MSLYQDLYIDDDNDFVFTEDGDIKIAEDGQVVAQDIKEAALASPGDIVWDAEIGKGIRDLIKDNDVGSNMIIAAIRMAAIEDIRINPDTVEAGINSETGKYYLVFTLYGSVNEEDLLFDLNELMGD